MEKKARPRKTLYEGKYVRLIGEEGWEFVERANCTGIVMMVGMTDDRKVVLVEQHRVPVGCAVIEFPAGLVNDCAAFKGETLEAAARREYEEETGYRPMKMELIMEGPASAGLSTNLVTIFRASGLKKVSAGGGDLLESITVHEVPLDQTETWLAAMHKRGFLIDPKVYAGLYFLNRP